MTKRATPGPWTYLEHRRDPGDAERTLITIRDARHLVLATLDRLDYAVSGEQTRANARLIAAAPRMAEALRALLVAVEAANATDMRLLTLGVADDARAILRELDGGA